MLSPLAKPMCMYTAHRLIGIRTRRNYQRLRLDNIRVGSMLAAQSQTHPHTSTPARIARTQTAACCFWMAIVLSQWLFGIERTIQNVNTDHTIINPPIWNEPNQNNYNFLFSCQFDSIFYLIHFELNFFWIITSDEHLIFSYRHFNIERISSTRK